MHKDKPAFSLAIDFFDEFGLERLTEPENPLNEMNSDFDNRLDKERALIKEKLSLSKSIWKPHPSAPGL